MGDLVNLNRHAKAKRKALTAVQATTNRTAHGRTLAQREAEAAAQLRREKLLDDAKMAP